ncbi:MAG: hypothetical protein U1G07_17115 [Verrucomicrobiota bacterium]
MKKRQIIAPDIEALASEVREGDGVDPRDEAKRKRHRAPSALLEEGFHQQERLGGQIRTAVDFALLAATTPVLNALTVHNVVKQKNTLVVVLVPRDATVPVDILKAAEAVKKAAAMLRCEVAAAITRKEAPNLRFIVLPAGSEQIDTDADEA